MEVLALAGFIFSMSVTPGPNVIMIAHSGVNFGFRRSIPHIFGITIGFTVLSLTVALGLGSLVKQFPYIETAIRLLGSAYLAYLATRIIISTQKSDETEKQGKAYGFLDAFVFQFANPKAWVMALVASAFLVSKGNPEVQDYLLYTFLILAILFPCVVAWNLFGVGLRRFLERPLYRKLFNFTMAALLLVSSVDLMEFV